MQTDLSCLESGRESVFLLKLKKPIKSNQPVPYSLFAITSTQFTFNYPNKYPCLCTFRRGRLHRGRRPESSSRWPRQTNRQR